MAFGKKNNAFQSFVEKGNLFEAYIEYMSDVEECERLLENEDGALHEGDIKEFRDYAGLWQAFREATIAGDLDKAVSIIETTPYGAEMGTKEAKSVLDDLAEKTVCFDCYRIYWKLCGQESVAEHAYALTMLKGPLLACPESAKPGREHQWFVINNTQKKERLKYLEEALEFYLQPHNFITDSDAAKFMRMANELTQKSKAVAKTMLTLFQRDHAAIEGSRPLVQQELYDRAIEQLGGVEDHQTHRTFYRGAYENRTDALYFYRAQRHLYELTGDAHDGFNAASAIWKSDLRQDEKLLEDSMALSLSVWGQLADENRDEYGAELLDQLYLCKPFPLDDDKAVAIANEVLALDPENDIARECLAIAKEQA